jgi:hypothetical protein
MRLPLPNDDFKATAFGAKRTFGETLTSAKCHEQTWRPFYQLIGQRK